MRLISRRGMLCFSTVIALLFYYLMWVVLNDMRKLCTSTSNKSIIIQANPIRDGRLFCWIMTSRNTYSTRAQYIKDLWPTRCDEHFFFTENNTGMNNPRFINVFQGLPDGHDKLWPKTQAALRFINRHFVNDFDWFLKADDDTYIIVENLRLFLRSLNLTGHHYFGHKIPYELKHGHVAGGSGYVMSKETLKSLVQALPNKTICPGGWAEDKEVAICLANLGIFPENTLNAKNISRFVPMHPVHPWYQLLTEEGKRTISEDVISIHQLSPTEIRLLDLSLYHFRLASLTKDNQ